MKNKLFNRNPLPGDLVIFKKGIADGDLSGTFAIVINEEKRRSQKNTYTLKVFKLNKVCGYWYKEEFIIVANDIPYQEYKKEGK